MFVMITDTTDTSKPPKPKVSRGNVGKEEAERILRLLEAEIVRSRRSRRQIERELGWSQGYLGSVLRRRIGLKVWHVFALSRELGIEPLSLFLTVSPPQDPTWILEQLGIAPPPPTPEPAPPAEEKPPVDWDLIEEMVRKLLREELAKFGLLEPEPAPS